MFIGFDDDIYKSEDGGDSWSSMSAPNGAYDILCDRVLSGVFYAWGKDGVLRSYIAGAASASMHTEAALNQALRLAQLPGTGAIYSLSNGALEKYQLGAWSSAEASVSGGAGLRAFQTTWIGYLNSNNVRFSVDGATFANKDGSGLTVSSPVSFHIVADV